MRRIGVLLALAAGDPVDQARFAAFAGLQQLGWMMVASADRVPWAPTIHRFRRYAAELVALAPEVILASGDSTVAPLLQVTRTVPIVFVIVPDPVGAGFVDSLARPGGNATGFSPRIRCGREMAGVAQRDRAQRDASGGSSRCRPGLRARPVRRHPVRCAVV